MVGLAKIFGTRYCPPRPRSVSKPLDLLEKISDLKIYLVDFLDLFLQTIFEPRSCPPRSRSGSDLNISLVDFSDLFLHK